MAQEYDQLPSTENMFDDVLAEHEANTIEKRPLFGLSASDYHRLTKNSLKVVCEYAKGLDQKVDHVAALTFRNSAVIDADRVDRDEKIEEVDQKLLDLQTNVDELLAWKKSVEPGEAINASLNQLRVTISEY
eukprot:372018_1